MTNNASDTKKEICYYAYRNQLSNLMLIMQSDTWLSEEEGNENMVNKIRGKGEKEKRMKGEREKDESLRRQNDKKD